MKRLGIFYHIVLSLLLGMSVHRALAQPASSQLLNPSQVLELIDRLSLLSSKEYQSLASDHPDYPVVSTLNAWRADSEGKPKDVIEGLEPLLQQIYFSPGTTPSKGHGTQLWVGTVGSYDLWRDTAYLLLGRAYYERDDAEKAVHYFNGVSETSIWAIPARISAAWSELKRKDYGAAEKAIERASNIAKGGVWEREAILQKACLAIARKQIDRAIDLAREVPEKSGLPSALRAVRAKVVAEANFQLFLKLPSGATLKEKMVLLNEITKSVEAVPQRERDASLSFLAGETYWHLASALRMDSLEKNKNQWMTALEQANQWIGPWASRTVQENRAILNEDALFFSVAVLWEQDRKQEAIPRLQAVARIFPQGEYREDSYQLLADYYYEQGKFNEAVTYYSLLSEVGSPEKASYGIYKAAWSFYNMQKKWKALRHLERLVLHYYQTPDRASLDSPGSLLKESEKDLFVVMGELMPYKNALKELEFFPFKEHEKLTSWENLARTYKLIGRYDDSIAVLQVLLQEQKGTVRSYSWLAELLDTLLSAGRRASLASMLSFYYGDLPKSGGAEVEAARAELEKKIVGLTLTIHREAKKTDDPDIWKAVDALYAQVVKSLGDISNGEFWYFGAQRQEKLNQKTMAVKWYKKAAENVTYSNREDAAVTVLRLDRDRLSAETSAEVAADGIWFKSQFPKREERVAAEFLVLDAYHLAKDYRSSKEFLVDLFKKDGANNQNQERFFQLNKRIYDQKNWVLASEFATEVLGLDALSSPKSADFKGKVSQIRQESAFQTAFSFEQAGKKSEARQWYSVAVKDAADSAVTLKAWHNLMLSYDSFGEGAGFDSQWGDFKVWQSKNSSRLNSGSSKNLIKSIYLKASAVKTASGDALGKGQALLAASGLEDDSEKSDNLRWDAMITFGVAFEREALISAFKEFKNSPKKNFSSLDNRVAAARLLFWNHFYTESWAELVSVLSLQKPPPGAWLLLRDFYAFSKGGFEKLHLAVKDYILKNRKILTQNSFLQPLWIGLLYPDFDSKEATGWMELDARAPATKGPANPLAERLQKVSKTLQELSFNQGRLKTMVGDPIPQVTVAVVCAAPALEAEAVRRLELLKNPEIESPQWPAFLQKLQGKIAELKQIERKEQALCVQQKEQLAYLPRSDSQASPICEKPICFTQSTAPSRSQFLELQKGNAQKNIYGRLDAVHSLLELGAWPAAELVAYDTRAIAERSLILGMIRLAAGDSWNAAPLLQEAAKTPQIESLAGLFLARIHWRNGNSRLANEQMKSVRPDSLKLDWLRELASPIRSPASR